MARRRTRTTQDGVVVKQEFLSLWQEVLIDFGEQFAQLTADSFDVPLDQITDIDEFRVHYKPELAWQKWMMDLGHTRAEIAAMTAIEQTLLKQMARVSIMAVIFDHGKLPGQSFPDSWNDMEEII